MIPETAPVFARSRADCKAAGSSCGLGAALVAAWSLERKVLGKFRFRKFIYQKGDIGFSDRLTA
jgi:hypothetical protein